MGMFTNFSKTTHPDNRFEFRPKEKVDEIMDTLTKLVGK